MYFDIKLRKILLNGCYLILLAILLPVSPYILFCLFCLIDIFLHFRLLWIRIALTQINQKIFIKNSICFWTINKKLVLSRMQICCINKSCDNFWFFFASFIAGWLLIITNFIFFELNLEINMVYISEIIIENIIYDKFIFPSFEC